MKQPTMKQLLARAECRVNMSAYLHISEIIELRDLLGEDISKLSFKEAVNKVREHPVKAANRRRAMEILVNANDSIRTERFRYDNGKVFQYDADQRAYIFVARLSRVAFNELVSRKGKYID